MYKIFPCRANKRPLIDEWQAKASNDPAVIKGWIETYGTNIGMWGVPTGHDNGILVLDVDVKKANGFETIKERNLFIPDSRAQRTQSGGAHYFFEYPRNGKHYGNRVNFLPGLDIRGDGGYICFYDGSQDTKPLLPAPDWLLATLGRPNLEIVGVPAGVSPKVAHETLTRSLAAVREADEGTSNAVLNSESFRIGQLIKAGSLERQFAFDQLFQVAIERKGPAAKDECIATINSGFGGGDKKPLTSPFDSASIVSNFVPPVMPEPPGLPARWTPPPISLHELFDRSKLRKPQLFHDWSTEDIHITTADGGTGKTTLKLYEAIHLALGERFLGFDCKQKGKTLFITGEDTEPKLKSMVGELVRSMGLCEEGDGNREKIDIILDSIRIKKDVDLCLIQKNKHTGFIEMNPSALNKILEAVADFGPKMIVFDPISSFWGSESALNDMNKAVTKLMSELVEKTNCCVEMINHMGKQSSQQRDMSQFAGRGGSGLPSNSRVSRVLRRIDETEYRELTGDDMEPGTDAILCNVNKFTDGSPLYNKPFLIIRDGYTFVRRILNKKESAEAEKFMPDDQRVMAYVKQQLAAGRLVNKTSIIGHFGMQKEKLSRDRCTGALQLLSFDGYMGEKLKLVQGPDASVREKIYVLADSNDVEI